MLLLTMLDILVGAHLAAAHADLQASDPAAGTELASAPPAVTLQFSEAVSIVSRAVVVLDDHGARVDSGDAQHPGSDPRRVSTTLRPGLPAGSYTVLWRVVSDDSHPVSGTFAFGVRVAPAAPVAPTSSADSAVTVLHWVAELLALAGVVVLGGSAFFIVSLWPEGLRSRRARRVLGVSAAVALVGNGLLLLVAGAYGTGDNRLLDPAAMRTVLGTTSGRLTGVRLGILVLAVLWWRHLDRSGRSPSRFDVVGLWLVVAVSFSVSGHAGHSASPLLTSLVDVAHLTAVSAWVGGLVLLAVAHLRDEGGEVSRLTVLPRWSRLAATAVAVIAVSGAASALVQVASWSALVGTAYGRLVLGKVAVLVAVVLVAGFSRRLVPRVVRGVTTRALRRLVVVETLGAVAVLGLSAALVSTQPARDSYLPTLSTTVSARGGSVAAILHVTVRPTTPGFEGLTVSAVSSQGTAVPIEAARLRFVNAAAQIGPMEYPVKVTAGVVDDVLISVPAPGRWDVGLSLRVNGSWVTGAFSYVVGA